MEGWVGQREEREGQEGRMEEREGIYRMVGEGCGQSKSSRLSRLSVIE